VKKILIILIFGSFIFNSCVEKEKKITRIDYPEFLPLKAGYDTIIYKTLKLSDFNEFNELANTIDNSVCNDSIVKIKFEINDTIKRIQLFNFCYLHFGCVLLKQRNIIEIADETIIKTGDIYPIDSLFYIMKKDFGNYGKDDRFSLKPEKILIDISYSERKMDSLSRLLNEITNNYERINPKVDLHIRLINRIVIVNDTIEIEPAEAELVEKETFETENFQKISQNVDFFYPNQEIFITELLSVGDFPNDSIMQSVEKKEWFGLFRNDKQEYLKNTKILTSRVHDPIFDENENDKTGWRINTQIKDTSIVLIKKLPFLNNHKIEQLILKKKMIYPNDTLKFKYLNKDYTLFATGIKEKVQENPEWYNVTDYKLYITAKKNGKEITELLVSIPTFDDHMTSIKYVGDIDNDDFLDLIIETSRKYGNETHTLYLSKPTDDNKLFKISGQLHFPGC
jgi:hypothetical protein